MGGKATPLVVGVALVVMAPLLLVTAVLGSRAPQPPDLAPPAAGCGTPAVGASGWTTPMGVAYSLTSSFGYRSNPTGAGGDNHTGQDLAAGMGSPVLAASAGTVVAVPNLGGASYGLHIRIAHAGGVETIYAHLSDAVVKPGQVVQAGQLIGKEGSTGRSTGSHLHFEIRVNGAPVNPVPWLAQRGVKLDGKAGTAANGPAPQVADLGQGSAVGLNRSGALSQLQRDNARQIISVGQQLGLPSRAWVIAIATALQESTLGADASTRSLNGDGDVGIFQQRALLGWYADGKTVAENVALINDVRYGARTFYLGHTVGHPGAGMLGYHIPGLVNITGWEKMPLTQAAQAVQKSAFPGYYAKHEATAAALVQELSNATDCAQPITGNTPGAKAVNAAMRYLGTPYSWGGGGPQGPTTGICCSPGGQDGRTVKGFDCSGLTAYAWAAAGVRLPRVTYDQHKATAAVPTNSIQAGDLLFFDNDSHVGIADGKGGMIHAPRAGKPVEVLPNVLNDPYYGPRFQGATRPQPGTA